jgi:AcrR family transcriptional regulator
MARIIKDYAERRQEIINVAQRLVYTKGYEQMTVQDILDEIHISKGAFYHYFDSKQQLLEALIEHIQHDAQVLIIPIVNDPSLPALDKMQQVIGAVSSWKTARKDYLLALVRVWYADENAIVRQKVQTTLVKQIAPVFTTIVQQGIREGVFDTPYADQMGEIILATMQGLGEAFVDMLFFSEPAPDDLRQITKKVAAYTDALERILGTTPGCLKLMDEETITTWVNKQEKSTPQVVG